MHSVDVEEVGLPLPLLAEGQFVDCVISACFSLGEKFRSRRRQLQLHQFTLTFPPVKQKANDWGSKRRNQDSLHVFYASQVSPIIRCS